MKRLSACAIPHLSRTWTVCCGAAASRGRRSSQPAEYGVVLSGRRTKWGDQKKVSQSIQRWRNAEIVRYGVMHRNTFLNGPMVLRDTCQMKAKENIFFAGQMTGVEGYIESTASGLVRWDQRCASRAWRSAACFSRTTAIGALMNHVGNSPTDHFQPMNINFGLLPSPERRLRSKKERNAYYAERALGDFG